MEPNSPKKIQFAVPPLQNHLDPQAAEHIRRRRPTPATLVIYSDPSAAETDDKRTTSDPGEAQNAELTHPQVDPRAYTPPTMRELQLVVEQHLQKQEQMEAGSCEGMDPLSPSTDQHCPSTSQWANHSSPQNNGNEAYTSLLHSPEENMDSSSAGGDPSASEYQQGPLSSPSSISR